MSNSGSGNFALTVLVAIVTAVSSSYLTYQLVEKKRQHDTFVFDNIKGLYHDSSESLGGLEQSYSEVISVLSSSSAVSPRELDVVYSSFSESFSNYSDYIEELKMLGGDEQIAAAESILNWVRIDLGELALQLNMSKSLQRRAGELLRASRESEEVPEFFSKGFDQELLRLVQNENRIYFKFDRFSFPVFARLRQNLNLAFRRSLDLGGTTSIIDAVEGLPEAIERSRSFEYEEKSVPFVVADMRSRMSHDIEMSVEGGSGGFGDRKEMFLRDAAKIKFLSEAAHENPELVEDIEFFKDNDDES